MNIPDSLISSLLTHSGPINEHADRRAFLNSIPPQERSDAARIIDNTVRDARWNRAWANCPAELRANAEIWYDLCAQSTVPTRAIDSMTPHERAACHHPDDHVFLAAFRQVRLGDDGMILTRNDGTDELTIWAEMARFGADADRALERITMASRR